MLLLPFVAALRRCDISARHELFPAFSASLWPLILASFRRKIAPIFAVIFRVATATDVRQLPAHRKVIDHLMWPINIYAIAMGFGPISKICLELHGPTRSRWSNARVWFGLNLENLTAKSLFTLEILAKFSNFRNFCSLRKWKFWKPFVKTQFICTGKVRILKIFRQKYDTLRNFIFSWNKFSKIVGQKISKFF